MGYTIEVTCDKCNYRKIFNLGRPSQKALLEEVLKAYDRSVALAVMQMDEAYTINDYEYGKQLMCCKNCHAITNEELLIVEFKNAQDYLTGKYCTKCSSQLKIFDIQNIEHARCPACLCYGLRHKRICDWK